MSLFFIAYKSPQNVEKNIYIYILSFIEYYLQENPSPFFTFM